MDNDAYAVYVLHAQILKTLAQAKRLMILDYLHSGEKSVGELAELLGLPQANVSQHLAVLRAQEIVTARRDRQTVWYSCSKPLAVQILSLLGIAS